MTRDEIISGLEAVVRDVRKEPAEKMLGVFITADEAEEIAKLLKEQEAVKPVPPEDGFGLYRCGKCYQQLFRCVDKYCSRCGQAVKWE